MAWKLVNTHPFREIEKTRTEEDKLWDTFYWGVPEKSNVREEPEWLPSVDMAETRNEVIVNMEIPGIDPQNIDIFLGEGVLTVKGERKQKAEEGEETYHVVERRYGAFTRSIPIPGGIKYGKASASYKNGVLRVVLPKSAESKKKEIKIKVE